MAAPAFSSEMLHSINCEAAEKALKDLLTEVYKRQYIIDPPQVLAAAENYTEELRYQHRHDYLFITINPLLTTQDQLYEFIEAVHGIPTYTWVKTAVYAFESRSKDLDEATSEVPPGFHVHLLIKRNKRQSPSTIQKGLYSGKWKKWCGNPQHIHISSVTNLQAPVKLTYITAKDKEHFDPEMRASLGLLSHYSKKE